MKAVMGDVVLAESDKTVMVEGNQYFPPDSINREYFDGSDLHTTCSWKGVASYYDVTVNGETESDVAWYYPDTSEAAEKIKDYVAFYTTRGVKVVP